MLKEANKKVIKDFDDINDDLQEIEKEKEILEEQNLDENKKKGNMNKLYFLSTM
jgi:hypothetical protein